MKLYYKTPRWKLEPIKERLRILRLELHELIEIGQDTSSLEDDISTLEIEYQRALSFSQEVDTEHINAGGKIVFGATATILYLDTNEKRTFQIVDDSNIDRCASKISIESPLAQYVIGRRVGDEFDSPDTRPIRVISVQYV